MLRLTEGKGERTCDQAGDDEGQDQHLEHPHQQLSREGEIFDVPDGQLVRTQGESQHNACTEMK